MEPEFWHERWESKQIAFHEPDGNALLSKWFHELCLAEGRRIFVPLCGKTRDISWLLSQGVRVVGVELSAVAVDELFDELGIVPEASETGVFRVYSASNLEIFVGDFFKLSGALLGQVHAIYDRAALVAMPNHLRGNYSEHLIQITDRSPQLVISFEYDQDMMEGPPFSVSAAEISSLYAEDYELKCLEKIEVPGGLKGICAAEEQVWCLT